MSVDQLVAARGFDDDHFEESDVDTEPQLLAGGPMKKSSSEAV